MTSSCYVFETPQNRYGVSNVTMAGSYSNDMQFRTNCYIEELNTDLPLPFYDFTARMQLCLFQRPDPKATDYTWLNPFTYCAADPVNCIDPDGKFSFRIFASAAKYIRKVYKIYKKTGTLTVKNLKQAGIDEVTDVVGDLYTVFDSEATVLDKIEAGVDLVVGTDLNNKGDKTAKNFLGLADDVNTEAKRFDDILHSAELDRTHKGKSKIYRKKGE